MATKYEPLHINPKMDESVAKLLARRWAPTDARAELGVLLQAAICLEFGTIPPYLAAAYSLDNNNERIKHLLLRIAREEMLHMTAVANIMNAIGITPDIVAATPVYPCDLNVLDPPLRLDLKSFSLAHVEDLLMRIEAPEDPVSFPKDGFDTWMALAPKPRTIGQFYSAIIEIIESDAIEDLFINAERDLYKQVEVRMAWRKFAYLSNEDLQEYGMDEDITLEIRDKASAVRHLHWIVDQGEGADPLDPLSTEGIPGHYYRLASILEKRYLIKDSLVPVLGHSYSGADLTFDPLGVHEFDDNPKLADYAAHIRVARQMKKFNEDYTSMVDALHTAFRCPSPDLKDEANAAYQKAAGRMMNMPNLATAIVQSAKSEGIKGGLPFEYKNTN